MLVTIDTEGDGLWWRPRRVETRNAAFLPRFQALCERYGLRPTYLTTYEMALSPRFRELGVDVLRRGTGEIGTHLHAWDSPPAYRLTADDLAHHPYLTEYPPAVMRAKIEYLSDLLEETFQVPMRSHRAGRWKLDERYARLLLERGYRVDCSVTPYVSWASKRGDPQGGGGADYSAFPDDPYFVNLDDIGRPGSSPLLEVPMTIRRRGSSLLRAIGRLGPAARPLRVLAGRLFPARWLRPNGRNVTQLLRLADVAVAERRRYVQCMLHSSELMPGGSPSFPSEASIERLYEHLEQLFGHVTRYGVGTTLADFHSLHAPARPARGRS
ncbi:MAG TPA: deacetylase [Candidatus Binatia bacterium]|nr:deacetylase [Candidatus Binatia bacterium]